MISNKYLVASDTETNNIATTVAINLATWKRTTQRQPLRSTSRPSNEQLSATLCRSRWSLTLVADAGDHETNISIVSQSTVEENKF